MSTKDRKQTIRRARKLGCVVTVRKNGHYKIVCPNRAVIYASVTPSDHRAERKLIAQLRRDGGLDI